MIDETVLIDKNKGHPVSSILTLPVLCLGWPFRLGRCVSPNHFEIAFGFRGGNVLPCQQTKVVGLGYAPGREFI